MKQEVLKLFSKVMTVWLAMSYEPRILPEPSFTQSDYILYQSNSTINITEWIVKCLNPAKYIFRGLIYIYIYIYISYIK